MNKKTITIVSILSIMIVVYLVNAISTRTISEDDTLNSLIIKTDLTVSGTLKGSSPVKMREGLDMTDSGDNVMFQLGVKGEGDIGSGLDAGFDDTLLLMTTESNVNHIEFMIWDDELHRPIWAFNEGFVTRANVSERSLMVGSSGTYDGDYTLCFNNDYVGCDTDVTGADLLVQDDFEAVGSIYTQENLQVDGDATVDGTLNATNLGSGTSYVTNLYATNGSMTTLGVNTANIDTGNITTINNTTLNVSDVNTTNFSIYERSTDVAQPVEGHCSIWLSDGIQKGDDGDLLIACTAGGSTTWGTLFDKSNGTAW